MAVLEKLASENISQGHRILRAYRRHLFPLKEMGENILFLLSALTFPHRLEIVWRNSSHCLFFCGSSCVLTTFLLKGFKDTYLKGMVRCKPFGRTEGSASLLKPPSERLEPETKTGSRDGNLISIKDGTSGFGRAVSVVVVVIVLL